MPFAKGQSGNPGGRRSVPPSLRKLYRMGAAEGARLALRFVRDEEQDPRVRMKAIEFLTDRGYGKAVQPTELSGPNQGPLELRVTQMGDAEVRELLEQRLKRLELTP